MEIAPLPTPLRMAALSAEERALEAQLSELLQGVGRTQGMAAGPGPGPGPGRTLVLNSRNQYGQWSLRRPLDLVCRMEAGNAVPGRRRHLEYDLTVRQQPKQARMCGVSGKDRRPIDPPPIVELRVRDLPNRDFPGASGADVRDMVSFLENPYYFMFASLASVDTEEEMHLLKDGHTRCTTGQVVSSLYHLKDQENRGSDAGFFVFPDLSVRTEGSYRLKLSLFEIVGMEVQHCKSIFSKPFYVYTAKKFPGMEESTPLSCSLADQGIKIRIRKDIRVRKRPQQQRERYDDDEGEGDTPMDDVPISARRIAGRTGPKRTKPGESPPGRRGQEQRSASDETVTPIPGPPPPVSQYPLSYDHPHPPPQHHQHQHAPPQQWGGPASLPPAGPSYSDPRQQQHQQYQPPPSPAHSVQSGPYAGQRMQGPPGQQGSQHGYYNNPNVRYPLSQVSQPSPSSPAPGGPPAEARGPGAYPHSAYAPHPTAGPAYLDPHTRQVQSSPMNRSSPLSASSGPPPPQQGQQAQRGYPDSRYPVPNAGAAAGQSPYAAYPPQQQSQGQNFNGARAPPQRQGYPQPPPLSRTASYGSQMSVQPAATQAPYNAPPSQSPSRSVSYTQPAQQGYPAPPVQSPQLGYPSPSTLLQQHGPPQGDYYPPGTAQSQYSPTHTHPTQQQHAPHHHQQPQRPTIQTHFPASTYDQAGAFPRSYSQASQSAPGQQVPASATSSAYYSASHSPSYPPPQSALSPSAERTRDSGYYTGPGVPPPQQQLPQQQQQPQGVLGLGSMAPSGEGRLPPILTSQDRIMQTGGPGGQGMPGPAMQVPGTLVGGMRGFAGPQSARS